MGKPLKAIIALVLIAPLVYSFYLRGFFTGPYAHVAYIVFLTTGFLAYRSVISEDNKTTPAAGTEPGAAGKEPAIAPAGIEIKSTIPVFVQITGGLLALGVIYRHLLLEKPDPRDLLLLPAGAVVVIAGQFIYGDSVCRRNIARYAVALVSSLAIIGAIMTGVFIAAGAFDPPQIKTYAGLAVAAFFAGCAGAYYGLKYQQSQEGVAIGRELGFSDADSGPTAADGFYDSKGRLNGVETLFNIEQVPAYKNTPARFTLEVLCRCANPMGVKLEIRPRGIISGVVGLSTLPKLRLAPAWERYVVRCDQEQAALKPLAEAKNGDDVFTDAAGFSGLELSGTEFKAVFRLEGYVGTAYVKRVLEGVTRLASCFN